MTTLVAQTLLVDDLVLDVPTAVATPPLNFTLPAGQSLAISGPSGTGKTTLLTVLAGLAAPASGKVMWGATTVGTSDMGYRRSTAYIQQGYGLVSTLTALENVAAFLLGQMEPADCWHRAEQALSEMNLADNADQLVDRMSGGQQQRVAVARALASDPSLIIADEPTSELDAANRATVLDALFRRQVDDGRTLVIATHDPDVADRCAHQLRLGSNGARESPARHRA